MFFVASNSDTVSLRTKQETWAMVLFFLRVPPFWVGLKGEPKQKTTFCGPVEEDTHFMETSLMCAGEGIHHFRSEQVPVSGL